MQEGSPLQDLRQFATSSSANIPRISAIVAKRDLKKLDVVIIIHNNVEVCLLGNAYKPRRRLGFPLFLLHDDGCYL